MDELSSSEVRKRLSAEELVLVFAAVQKVKNLNEDFQRSRNEINRRINVLEHEHRKLQNELEALKGLLDLVETKKALEVVAVAGSREEHTSSLQSSAIPK
ncbi:hypothetical protein FJTKL_11671 [Diaporthe vaccinii]|uniref:Uncharacterized protein n=1 Tax=Diaporthe vaccinii TaxID=105482 RepID=A0ABR4EFL7_9PEZI